MHCVDDEIIGWLIVANQFLETELERLKATVSTGYARGKLFEVAKTLPRDRGTGMIELVGLIPLHASPHTIYDHMDKKLHARTAKDQGPASRDADRGCPQYAARAEAPAKGHERSRLGGLTHI